MTDDRNQDRIPRQQVKRKRPVPWQQDLNPNHPSGQNIGRQSDAQIESEWRAFHLRKRGLDPGGVNDEQVEQAPVGTDDGRPLGGRKPRQ